MPKKNTIELDSQVKRELAITAQFLGLQSPEQLATIVLRAFLEMQHDTPEITFPLMLQHVTRKSLSLIALNPA